MAGSVGLAVRSLLVVANAEIGRECPPFGCYSLLSAHAAPDGCAKPTGPVAGTNGTREGKGGAEWYAMVDSYPHLGADVPAGPKDGKINDRLLGQFQSLQAFWLGKSLNPDFGLSSLYIAQYTHCEEKMIAQVHANGDLHPLASRCKLFGAESSSRFKRQD